jgi:hypothetical protein
MTDEQFNKLSQAIALAADSIMSCVQCHMARVGAGPDDALVRRRKLKKRLEILLNIEWEED